MAGRAHGHTEGLRKPHLMQWVLQQETPRKQVLLQIFSGTPERECAHRMHMTLGEVQAIERWCAEKGPIFVEDDYVMSYYATNSREEFCRATGQSEGVYRLMELRYPKEHRHTGGAGGGHATGIRGGSGMRPAGSGVRASHMSSAARDDEAARGRREERRAAREQERERRRGEDAYEPPATREVPKPAAAPSNASPKANTAMPTQQGKTAPTNPFDLPPRKTATAQRAESPRPAVPKRDETPQVPTNPFDMGRRDAAPTKPPEASKREEATRPKAEQPKQQPKRADPNTSEEHAKELAEMAGAACARCAERSVRPIPFSEFLKAFRRECNANGWTAEAVPGNAGLRRILERDHRVMWTGADEFWFFDWKEHGRSITQAVEHDALMGREYSVRHFYSKNRRLMRRLGVKVPGELYEILRRIYVDKDDEAVFGNHLSFGFGKIDRQKQIKRFVADHPGEPKSVLAMEYEREYGFSAGTAEIWIDLFARPDDVSLSEWVERETVGGTRAKGPEPAHTAAVEPEPLAAPAEKAAPERAAKPAAGEQPDWIAEELTAASVPFVDNRAKYGSLWVLESDADAELIERLRSEGANFRYTAAGGRATHYQPSWWVAGHPERRELTAEQSKEAVPAEAGAENLEKAVGSMPEPVVAEAPPEAVSKAAPEPEPETAPVETESKSQSVTDFLERELSGDICDASLVRARFSYEFPNEPDVTKDNRALAKAGYYEDHGLLFRTGKTPNEHFTRLLSTSPSFSKGDPGFEGAVWKHQTFRYVLRGALANHQVLLYERPDSYISFSRLHEVLGTKMADMESYAPAVCAAVPQETPFTIRSLREGLGFTHPLDGLDMPDAFYEGLLDASGLLRSCTMAGTKVFVTGSDERLSANSFMEWLVSKHEGIFREDVPRLLQKDYGIDYPMVSVITTVYNSSVYHDDVGDAYYSSMEAWKQEARNELNEPA